MMAISLDYVENYNHLSPSLVHFSNIFQNCSIYLLSLSLAIPTYRHELELYAGLYSQLIGTPVVIETLLVHGKWGPKFTRNALSAPLLKFTSGNRVQIYLHDLVTYLSLSAMGLNETTTLIHNSNERHDYYVFFVNTEDIYSKNFQSSLKSFKDINVGAKFIFVHNELRFTLLCVFCPMAPPPQPEVFYDINGRSREEIGKIHNRIHGDLHGAGIVVKVNGMLFKECSSYDIAQRMGANRCLLYEVSHSVNASAIRFTGILSAT